MATDVERLVVSLEASITKYERAMQRALGQTNATAARIETRFAKMGSAVSGGFGKIFALTAAGVSLKAAGQLVDASTRIQNSLKVTGLEGEALTSVYDRLFQSAQKNAVPLESLVSLYSRASLAQKELGVTSSQLVSFADNVGLALRLSGQSAEASSGALLQLSQALGSGTVHAEEFSSILEGAPTIARAAAAGLEEAGGSVAKLRQLVIDGKVSSETLFNAFQAGAGILRDQVATSVFTLSQRFENLNTALIDSAGRIDKVSGASERLGQLIDFLANGADNAGRDFENWAEFFELMDKNARGAGQALDDIPVSPLDDLIAQAQAANDAVFSLEGSIRDIAVAQADVFPEEVRGRVQDIVDGFLNAGITASEATAKLHELGSVDADFAPYIGALDGLINAMQMARTNAQLLNAEIAAPQGPVNSRGKAGAAMRRLLGGDTETVSTDDAPTLPRSGTGKGSKSPEQKFKDDLDAQARRNENLRQETALQATLNPLVNDYGYAMEKLRVQQDLENDATKAGLELTPDRKAAIAELAEGYALATVEAQKLADAQDLARESMQDWFDLGRDAARGFIDDLVEGKSAAEALGNVFQKLGNKLLDMGLDSLFGTGSGSNPFGLIGKAFGFADGGIAKNGKPMKAFARGGVSDTAAIFGEGPMAEAAVPLPDGRRIPVDLRMPRMPAMPQASSAGPSFTFAPTIDARGADAATVARLEQMVARQGAEFEGRVRKVVASRAKDRW